LERGSVLDLMRKAKMSVTLKVKIMHDAARAVEFLHENGVIYRDLKPENLLVFSVAHKAKVNVTLSDFGTARSVENVSALVKYSVGVGTPIYMAPELMNASPYNCKVDVYALGMLMWEIMAERHPFYEVKRVWDVPRLVVSGMRPACDDRWPAQVRDLIAICWLQSPQHRPNMSAVASALSDFYEIERDDYEKIKKKKKKAEKDEFGMLSASPSGGLSSGTLSSGMGSPTANTGKLEELIEKSMQEPARHLTGELHGVARAADMMPEKQAASGVEEGDHDPPKKEKKKKRSSKK